MDGDVSPLQQFSRIEQQLNGLLAVLHIDEFDVAVRKKIESIRRNLEISRKLLRDYENEEDSQLQSRLLPQSIERISNVHKHVLEASQYDVFGPVDVAHLSAMIDELLERLA